MGRLLDQDGRESWIVGFVSELQKRRCLPRKILPANHPLPQNTLLPKKTLQPMQRQMPEFVSVEYVEK
jgi:hypothetical protein